MKTLKIFLVVVTILLIGALLLGVYVWYSIQNLSSVTQDYNNTAEQPVDAGSGVKIKEITEVSNEEVEAAQDGEVIEIHAADLSESQQKTLQTLGIKGDTFIITDKMITCAKDAVGEVRYEEILNGAAPSPLESIKLLPCMN